MFWLGCFLTLTTTWLIPTAINHKISTAINNRLNYKTDNSCIISKIYDGDTVTATCNQQTIKIRFWCIDAPEIKQQPWVIKSRDHLRKLIANNQPISIRKIKQDNYGRTIAELIGRDKTIINKQMVSDGKAAVYTKYCTDRSYQIEQQTAKQLGLGIWQQQGLQQMPWKWRRR